MRKSEDCRDGARGFEGNMGEKATHKLGASAMLAGG